MSATGITKDSSGPGSIPRSPGAWVRRAALAGVVGVLLLGMAPGAHAGASAREPVGTARNAIGLLLVNRTDGSTDRLQGQGSLPLFEGDELKTGPRAQAFIEFTDGTRVALNEWTTFIVRSRTRRDTGLTRILRLIIGEMWMRTSARAGSLEVETPTAIAAIRGTEVNIKYRNNRGELTVVTGLVGWGRGRSVLDVAAGMRSVAERGRRPTPPTQVDVRRVVAWTQGLIAQETERERRAAAAPTKAGAGTETTKAGEQTKGVKTPAPGEVKIALGEAKGAPGEAKVPPLSPEPRKAPGLPGPEPAKAPPLPAKTAPPETKTALLETKTLPLPPELKKAPVPAGPQGTKAPQPPAKTPAPDTKVALVPELKKATLPPVVARLLFSPALPAVPPGTSVRFSALLTRPPGPPGPGGQPVNLRLEGPGNWAVQAPGAIPAPGQSANIVFPTLFQVPASATTPLCFKLKFAPGGPPAPPGSPPVLAETCVKVATPTGPAKALLPSRPLAPTRIPGAKNPSPTNPPEEKAQPPAKTSEGKSPPPAKAPEDKASPPTPVKAQ